MFSKIMATSPSCLVVSLLLALQPSWTPQTTGVTVTFRGVSAVDAEVAWVTGSRGMC